MPVCCVFCLHWPVCQLCNCAYECLLGKHVQTYSCRSFPSTGLLNVVAPNTRFCISLCRIPQDSCWPSPPATPLQISSLQHIDCCPVGHHLGFKYPPLPPPAHWSMSNRNFFHFLGRGSNRQITPILLHPPLKYTVTTLISLGFWFALKWHFLIKLSSCAFPVSILCKMLEIRSNAKSTRKTHRNMSNFHPAQGKYSAGHKMLSVGQRQVFQHP